MAIHPRQVDVINDVFTPAAADVDRSKRVIDAYEAARAAGETIGSMSGLPTLTEGPLCDARPAPTRMSASALQNIGASILDIEVASHGLRVAL